MIIEKFGLGAITLPMGLGVLEPSVLVSIAAPRAMTEMIKRNDGNDKTE